LLKLGRITRATEQNEQDSKDKDVTDIAGLENDLRVNSKHRQQPTDQNVDRTAVSLARKKERKKRTNS